MSGRASRNADDDATARWQSQPRRLGDVLGRVVDDLAGPSGGGLELFSHWDELVGETLAARVRPVAIEASQLVVVCDDPAWATQIRWLGPDVLAAIAAAGGPKLSGLIVRVRHSR